MKAEAGLGENEGGIVGFYRMDGRQNQADGQQNSGSFFRRVLASWRAKTPAERIALGDALFGKAGKLVDEAGEGKPPLEAIQALTEALRQYTAAYYKASRKYNEGARLTERKSDEMLALIRKARAGRAVCYYGLGRLHERRNEIDEARVYYAKAEMVKIKAIVLNANYPEDCTTNDAATKAKIAIKNLGKD